MRDNLSQRPKIDVPETHWDYVANTLALVAVVLCLFLLLISWTDRSDLIPAIILPDGEPVDWDDRWAATLFLGTAVAHYVLLRLIARVPRYFNYPWPITPENAAIQYRLARSMIYWLNAIIVWMFLLIVWSQIRAAAGATDHFPVILVIASLVLIHLELGVFIYRAYRHRHGERTGDRTSWHQT